MTHIILWPSGFIGRLIAIFAVAVLFQFASSIFLHDQVDRYTLREDHARRVAELLVVGERLLSDVEPARRPQVLSTLSTEHLKVELKPEPLPAVDDEEMKAIRERIIAWEPSLANHQIRLATAPNPQLARREDLVGSMLMDDGSWLHFRSRDIFGHWPLLYRTFGTAGILAVGVLIFAAVFTQAAAAPLRALARAADHVGLAGPAIVSETGPGELSRLARAFNAMQARITALIADRSLALAAVGHDLRTPLSRLRLRADMIADDEERNAMVADIGEMEAMLDSVLALLSGDSDPEAPRLVDVVALIATLVGRYEDRRDVSYAGPDHCLLDVRPLALKRALGNLIENGLKYGRRVAVELGEENGFVRIRVEDDGPGIPEADLARVTEPFVRLDEARQRDTPGLGLGLSIAARAAEREGGRLRLSNRSEGGLRADILLPPHGA